MGFSDVERIMAFEHRFAKAQVTDFVNLPWGFAVLQADFPYSHYHNRIVVTSAASSGQILATADELLGGAGLKHRYVAVEDDALGEALCSEFVSAGYEHETIVAMTYSGPEPDPPTHEVRAVLLDVLMPALMRDWAIELPDASDEELRQLAGRTALYSRGAAVTLLAVFDGNVIVARAELYVDRVERVAQLENVFTHPDFRGRGYGNSLVREALKRGRKAGCELSSLTADLDDWPYDWYLRCGYVDSHRTHHFNRV